MILVDALIPAFNEAATIDEVVRGIRPLVRSVTVVDDGSTDGTGERARGAGAVVIDQRSNGGKGAAIRVGLPSILAGPCFARAVDGWRPSARPSRKRCV